MAGLILGSRRVEVAPTSGLLEVSRKTVAAHQVSIISGSS